MMSAQGLLALQGGCVAGETSRHCLTYSAAFAAPASCRHEAANEALHVRSVAIADLADGMKAPRRETTSPWPKVSERARREGYDV